MDASHTGTDRGVCNCWGNTYEHAACLSACHTHLQPAPNENIAPRHAHSNPDFCCSHGDFQSFNTHSHADLYTDCSTNINTNRSLCLTG